MNKKITAIIASLFISSNLLSGIAVSAAELRNNEYNNISNNKGISKKIVKNLSKNIVIEDMNISTELKKGTDAVIKIKVTNKSDNTQNASLIVGLFNDRGKLVKHIMIQEKLGKETRELEARMKLPNKEDKGCYVLKSFVWDNLQEMHPLSNIIEMKVKDNKEEEILSAETEDSTNIILNMKQDLKYQYGDKNAFNINGAKINPNIEKVKINNDKVILTLDKPIKKGEEITVNYKLTGLKDLTYSNGNKVEEIKNYSVKNNLKNITIMAYVDADNNVEPQMLADVREMQKGLSDDPNLNVVTLIDRAYGETKSGVGEKFKDARLYKLGANKATRIGGGKEFPEITTTSNYEANMGDPHTLKKFIKSCKENYKADQYVLVVLDHGAGTQGFCIDESNNNDIMNIGQVSDVLTKEESVDLLVFEACLMGNAEIAYQFRPGNGGFEAKGMVASSPTMLAYGLKYDSIFRRLKYGGGNTGGDDHTLGGKELIYDPSTVTMGQLAGVILEEQYNSLDKFKDQVLAYYDLSKVSQVKENVDELAKCLWKNNKKDIINEIRGDIKNEPLIMYYFSNVNSIFANPPEEEWRNYPYFDLYDFAKKIYNNYNKEFNDETCEAAKNVMKAIDNFIVYSYAGEKYTSWNFKEGKTGVSIFLPDGDRHWKDQVWYTSEKLKNKNHYGNLYWCSDGQTKESDKIGNWFDLLNSWYKK